MRMLNVGLTDEQRAARRNGIGGSDANVLMAGDEAAILRLWEEKTGAAEPEDLSNVLPVMMGSWTEELNRWWFERQTGRAVTNEGESRAHPEQPFITCTLDGLTTTEDGTPAVFEAKHVNPFLKIEEIEQRYMPQLHHNMAVCGVSRAVLSVFLGTQQWAHTEVALDEWYLAELLDRERAFWAAVEARERPPFLSSVAAPVKPENWRTVDMDGSNEWSALSADWLAHRTAAKTFADAEKGLKGLVEPDVGHAYGYGVQCKRSKNGALRLSEVK